jgi:DNA-binding IscR family transcriptional regulator
MQITRQADYAVRAVLHLARSGNSERAATSMIAKEQKIPPSFLAKIISQLSIAGLLDGPIQLNECVANDGVCTFEENCPIRPVWCEAQDELVKRLKNTNFADMLAASV